MQKQNNTIKIKYPLASAGKRILAKFLDIIIVSSLVLALGFIIFCTDPNFAWNQKLVLEQNWRYGLFVGLMAIIFFVLLLLFPRLWKTTIGMKACKLAFYIKPEYNKTFALFKHQLFIWEIVVIIAFAMGITLSFLTQPQIDALFIGVGAIFTSVVPKGIDKVCYYVGTTFSCLYSVCILLLIAIVIAICIRNHRTAFHDKYSNLYVINKKIIVENTKTSITNIKAQEKNEIRAPGDISFESLEEIDRI